METETDLGLADRIAMTLGGGLILLGVVVLGILEALIGTSNPVPVTNDAGEVVAATTFPVELRTALIAAGLVVLGLYAALRLFAGVRGGVERGDGRYQTAD